MEKYGFVYIWRDRKNNRYYVGCHWGTEDDGYICSSNWMRMSHKRRPQDFKRRIVAKIFTDRKDLLEEEQRWLDMINEDKIKPHNNKPRYYNLRLKADFNFWWADEERRKEVISKCHPPSQREKMSKIMTGRIVTEETKEKLRQINLGKKLSEETKKKISKNNSSRRPEVIAKIQASRKGYRHSEETKAKMRGKNNGFYGRKHSEESKAKMRKAYAKTMLEKNK